VDTDRLPHPAAEWIMARVDNAMARVNNVRGDNGRVENGIVDNGIVDNGKSG
jgi:hypothetical protein